MLKEKFNTPSKGFMKKISIVVLFVVFTLILISEICLRTFYFEQLKTRKTTTNKIPDSLRVFIREPNVEEAFITPSVNSHFRSNNMGYVGPDFSLKKKTGVFRIIVVGNSEVVGKQQMHGENDFCTVLQRIFKINNMKVEVINCAREGTNKDIQNLYIIKNDIVKYEPDLILLENGGQLNYCRYVFEGYGDYTLQYDPSKPETRAECVKVVDKINKHRLLTKCYDVSFIVRAICKRYVDKHSNWNVQALYSTSRKFEKYLYTYIKKDANVYIPTYRVSWDYALTELGNVKSKLDSIGCQLMLYTYSGYSDEFKRTFKENEIDFIQLNMNYGYLPLNSKLEGHTNELGHALIAERLFSQLVIKRCSKSKQK